MFNSLLKSATEAVSSATQQVVDGAAATEDTVKNGNVAEIATGKVKDMNDSVVKSWVGDKDAPDERSFWDKVGDSAKKIGGELAVTGIKSWLAMTDSKTGIHHKAILGTGLAYFVLPADMIPDVIAGVGFTDDAAALTLAVNSVGNSITDEHEEQARQKWKEF